MPLIKEINPITNSHPTTSGSILGLKITEKKWEKLRDFANIVCSRESTYRTALDITAFDIPMMASDMFRGPKKFLESALEGLSGTVMVVIAPIITSIVGKISGGFILPQNMQDDGLHYLKFNMDELKDTSTFKAGLKRIKKEEPQDKNFIATLLHRTGKPEKAKKYKREGNKIIEFCNHIEKLTNEEIVEKISYIKKLKNATIIGESFIEGGWWGGFGLVVRGFRKYILKEDRFTGTMNYASDEESAQLGESSDMNFFQKTIGVIAIFISPFLNTFMLSKTNDEDAVKKSKFLSVVKDQYDMTHGVYPKLGLLFSMTTIPKWISVLTTSQGWYERTERLLKLVTVLPSWWLGHRVTNGLFALKADKRFAQKYSTGQGILVEPEFLKQNTNRDNFIERIGKKFPEPARIQHILKAVDEREKEELQKAQGGNDTEKIKLKYDKMRKEVEDLHANCLYKGFALHSLLVWVINMAVNYTTKLRALHALNK